ncbi:DUF5060 domain-containing protein [Paenibacillus sp. UNC451MF]|uniref:DUF5060 domain-containing protein n=1 Tax=Paenibacillus sp. UNC451MF TaxID=1449063 RepID=UPI000490E329|nr:DUF5060 domain-containing protein [Paenibacillus sp. UNC451MF]
MDKVAQWGIFELKLDGPSEGNPFTDIAISACFKKGADEAVSEGFYDGGGKYRIRFMPQEEGEWTYTVSSNCPDMDGLTGRFICSGSESSNHGPVRVKDNVHFQYADGTRYIPMGTTCYVWHLQSVELQEETLSTLKRSPFNKVRMCVFPKSYVFNNAEPQRYPFEGSKEKGFDFTRFCPDYFAHLENRISDLAELGIEADLILFHPYDEGRWGFDRMSPEQDERYLRYVIARLGAYRNVWWSLANEYDLMKHKQPEDWNRLFGIIQENDYGGHLRSIHNCDTWYDFGVPWITHASIQHADVRVASDCTKQYGKPVIIDECGYEGNLDSRWGSLTAEEMVLRIWEGNFRGGYVTHGETYLDEEEPIWWSHGGQLRGESVARIAFLRRVLEEAPAHMTYSSDRMDAATLEVSGEYYLQYFGPHRFSYREFALPEGEYEVDIIDTWNMTITTLEGTFQGRFRIDLPSKLYYALRIRRTVN